MSKTIGTTVGFVLSQVAFVLTAWAQSPTAVDAGPRHIEHSWGVSGGRDTLALRDIARTGTPVDASPVAWRGSGPAFLLQHRRVNGSHMLRFDLSGMQAGRFAYRTPVETVTRPASDSFRRLDARFEYRRYLFSDVLVRGLDIGAGLQGGAAQWWLSRHIDGDLKATESRSGLTTAIVAVVRFRRPSRFGVEIGWANGGHVGRSSERHSADAARYTRWGGGWLTDLVLAADVAVSRRASIGLQYVRADDGLMSSHRSFTSARRSMTVGVTYAK